MMKMTKEGKNVYGQASIWSIKSNAMKFLIYKFVSSHDIQKEVQPTFLYFAASKKVANSNPSSI